MIIFGIETSCDETACAILQKDKDRITILSNVVASSANLQSKYGGIIPEQAAREQIKAIIPVIEEALIQAFPNHKPYAINHKPPIDAIAVTYGPGLIGSLLVGVETAKILAKVWNKPLIPINHLLGHFYANWIETGKSNIVDGISGKNHKRLTINGKPKFPCLGLLVSGGHTDLVLFTDHGKYKYLGGTLDDAAGECFDKCARLLGLPYPGGPQISKLAESGDSTKFKLPLPMKGKKSFDFSYSGLKAAVARLVESEQFTSQRLGSPKAAVDSKADLAAAIEDMIVKTLVDKVVLAIQEYKVEEIIVAGGVAANQKLANRLQLAVDSLKSKIKLHVPHSSLCTDNGAMIAAAGFFSKKRISPENLQANPNLSL